LSEAIETVKGREAKCDVEPDIKLPVTAVLPESYIPQPMQRLGYYQRLTLASSDNEVYEIAGEIREIYGKLPPEVEYLSEVMVIRRRLRLLGASALSAAISGDGNLKMGMAFVPDAPVAREKLALLLQSSPDKYRFTPNGRFSVTVDVPRELSDSDFLSCVRAELREFSDLVLK